jgi:hypothetical protein
MPGFPQSTVKQAERALISSVESADWFSPTPMVLDYAALLSEE